MSSGCGALRRWRNGECRYSTLPIPDSASLDISADEFVVLAMRTNPEPMDAVRYREPECLVVEANLDAAISAVSNHLEVQRWVRRIGL